MSIIKVVFVLGFLSAPVFGCVLIQDENERTRQGGNELVTRRFTGIYRKLHGQIKFEKKPAEQVLVEIFDKPDWIIDGSGTVPETQKRLYSCITSKNGKFQVKNLPAGKYEVRISKDIRFNPIHIYIEIDSSDRRGKTSALKIDLSLGT